MRASKECYSSIKPSKSHVLRITLYLYVSPRFIAISGVIGANVSTIYAQILFMIFVNMLTWYSQVLKLPVKICNIFWFWHIIIDNVIYNSLIISYVESLIKLQANSQDGSYICFNYWHRMSANWTRRTVKPFFNLHPWTSVPKHKCTNYLKYDSILGPLWFLINDLQKNFYFNNCCAYQNNASAWDHAIFWIEDILQFIKKKYSFKKTAY